MTPINFQVNDTEWLSASKLIKRNEAQGERTYICGAGMAGRIIHTIKFVTFLSPLLRDYKLYKTGYNTFLLTN